MRKIRDCSEIVDLGGDWSQMDGFECFTNGSFPYGSLGNCNRMAQEKKKEEYNQ